MKRKIKFSVMVNNSNNINKANNHLSPQIIENKKTMTYEVCNQDHVLGQAQKCGRVKPFKGIYMIHSVLYNGMVFIFLNGQFYL